MGTRRGEGEDVGCRGGEGQHAGGVLNEDQLEDLTGPLPPGHLLLCGSTVDVEPRANSGHPHLVPSDTDTGYLRIKRFNGLGGDIGAVSVCGLGGDIGAGTVS